MLETWLGMSALTEGLCGFSGLSLPRSGELSIRAWAARQQGRAMPCGGLGLWLRTAFSFQTCQGSLTPSQSKHPASGLGEGGAYLQAGDQRSWAPGVNPCVKRFLRRY